MSAFLLQFQLLARQQKYAESLKASGRARELIESIFRDFQAFLQTPNGFWLHSIRQQVISAQAAGLIRMGRRDEAIASVKELDLSDRAWTGAPAYNVARSPRNSAHRSAIAHSPSPAASTQPIGPAYEPRSKPSS